jgi:FkbM family methyltransferase
VSSLHSIARKLWSIARSGLTSVDKLRYATNTRGHGTGVSTYRLRGGGSIALRNGTSDCKVFNEIFVERVYAPSIQALPENLGTVTLIDLGANIGLSTLFFARALEVTEIIAVEPDPDNFRMLANNLRTTGLANRCTAIHAFAGAEHARAELRDSGNGAWGMRMGPLSETGTPVLPLAQIAEAVKSHAPRILKCDIEGGERQLFLHIREWEHLFRYIILELHTELFPLQELHACLRSARFRWIGHGSSPQGMAVTILLLERVP